MLPESERLLQYFRYEHLPVSLQDLQRPYCELARVVAMSAPDSQETTVALRKLVESLDAAVRAALEPVALALNLAAGRSPHWPAVRAAHLKREPACRACGTHAVHLLEVHHIRPFHLWPELELDDGNLIALCQSPAHNCHLIWGHFLSFKDSWNPNVREDAALYREKLDNRPTFTRIEP